VALALAPTPSIINNHDASATAMRPYSDGRPAAARRGPSCMHVADDAGTVLAVIHILPPYPLMTTAPSPCAQPYTRSHAHACTVPGRDSVVIMPRRSVVLALRCVACGAGGPVLPREEEDCMHCMPSTAITISMVHGACRHASLIRLSYGYGGCVANVLLVCYRRACVDAFHFSVQASRARSSTSTAVWSCG
jgi:hypothetical protein